MTKLTKDHLISNVYYDAEFGYGSIKNIFEQVKNVDPSIQYDDYAMVVIDIFSKLGDAIPMKNKDSVSVYNALLIIFKTMGYPMSIYSDDDGAFKSKVQDVFDRAGINHVVTLTHANVVERFIRTLKNGIHDTVRFTKSKWEDMLTIVVNKYNNTTHSSINHTPN